jgi:hypothetical protein
LLLLGPIPAAAAGDSCAGQGIAADGCVRPEPPSAVSAPSAERLLAQMRATYAALRAYADSGTVVVEEQPLGAPMIVERHSFVTRYAAPRQFYFDFSKDRDTSDERFVIWCEGETFSSWWSATQTAERYRQGEGANAFAVSVLPTSGAALLIPPLLFQQAKLQGPLIDMSTPGYAGSEMLAGRLHHKLTAMVRLNHWSDATRPTTVWLDAETLLIRKVLEETPTGMGSGVVQRVTTTLEPRADLELDDVRFRFTPP